jgi:hypothetical protein
MVDGILAMDGILCPSLNLVTLEYTKKYDPYVNDFIYTPVIIDLTLSRQVCTLSVFIVPKDILSTCKLTQERPN